MQSLSPSPQKARNQSTRNYEAELFLGYQIKKSLIDKKQQTYLMLQIHYKQD